MTDDDLDGHLSRLPTPPSRRHGPLVLIGGPSDPDECSPKRTTGSGPRESRSLAINAQMIIALAGRRVSRSDARPQRFPESSAVAVRKRLEALFRDLGATTLVGSGACGADLLAMEVAGAIGLERRMVLPFDRSRFRARSVADAEYECDWGQLFDRIADEVEDRGGLIVLSGDDGRGSHDAYATANRAILDEAQRLACVAGADTGDDCAAGVIAVLVWDGQSRGEGDSTDSFRREAESRHIPIRSVSTLDGDPPKA
jgi:hypothetical protein